MPENMVQFPQTFKISSGKLISKITRKLITKMPRKGFIKFYPQSNPKYFRSMCWNSKG
jgi:hypothetical protein